MLSIRPFHRLWIATSLPSLGDWLSLLVPRLRPFTWAGAGLLGGIAAARRVWLVFLLPFSGRRPPTRGRTFAFLQSIAVASAVSTAFTALVNEVTGGTALAIGYVSYGAVGSNDALLLSAGVAIQLGVVSG